MNDSTKTRLARPVYEYDSYREFLKARFEQMKLEDPKFTYKTFARISGFRSPSYLFLVMKGDANLSLEASEQVSEALELDSNETFFFRNLVSLNQATAVEERQLYAQQLLKSGGYRSTKPDQEHIYQYLTHWYISAIQELAGLEEFRADSRWISERLESKVSTEQVDEALKELLALGLLQTDTTGKLRSVKSRVITPDEITGAFAIQYHEEYIKLGADSIRNCPRELRDVTGTTFKISREGFSRMKDVVQRFRKEVVEIVSQEENCEGLYQLNMQLFPLARIPKSGAKKDETKA